MFGSRYCTLQTKESIVSSTAHPTNTYNVQRINFHVPGSHGAAKNVQVIAFPTCQQAADYLMTELGCSEIIGLVGSVQDGYESLSVDFDGDNETSTIVMVRRNHVPSESQQLVSFQSTPVHMLRNTTPNCCLAVNQKSSGLPLDLAKHCSRFVHVPVVYELLDSPACLSIVLHEFTEQWECTEQGFRDQKFAIVRPNLVDMKTKRNQERLETKAMHDKEVDDIVRYGDLFQDTGEDTGDY